MPRPAALAFPRAAAIILLGLGSACGGADPAAPPVEPLPPLAAATWHVHEAEGQPLPALVAHGLEDGVLVQDFLDSATVDVRADGTWERRLWISRFRDQQYHAPVGALEAGTWRATTTAYEFTAQPSGRRFSLASLTPGQPVTFPLRGAAEGGIQARLRTAPPPPSLPGTFEIAEVRGAPVPAVMYVFNDFEEAGRVVSIHLVVDSAQLTLRSNGSYTHLIHYSEWEGPNHGAPTTLRFRFSAYDHGTWTRGPGDQVRFESGFLQNHRFGGSAAAPSRLDLAHGLSHGDPPEPVRYVRR